MSKKAKDSSKLDAVVANARRQREARGHAYREQALKLFPWICGRCQREFTHETLNELTVHHRDHDHDNNPEDGSNWELLCIYCHDNEHARYLQQESSEEAKPHGLHKPVSTHKPFAGLGALIKDKNNHRH